MSGGGSSGSSGMPYYASQDRLLGMQAEIAEGMYNQYANYAPNTLYDLARLVDDANSGDYENRLYERGRTEAYANNAAANALEREATARQLASMGVNPNDPRFAGSLRAADVNNAARLSSQLNASALNAQTAGEQMAWARSSDYYNMLAGMPTQSVAALGSAASGYGNMNSTAQQGYASGMAGFGNMGGTIAQELSRADGGPVRGIRPREQRFAVGGMVPVRGNGPYALRKLSGSYGGGGNGGGGISTGQALMAVATPVALQLAGKALKPAIDAVGDRIGAAARDVFSGETAPDAASADLSLLRGTETTANPQTLTSAPGGGGVSEFVTMPDPSGEAGTAYTDAISQAVTEAAAQEAAQEAALNELFTANLSSFGLPFSRGGLARERRFARGGVAGSGPMAMGRLSGNYGGGGFMKMDDGGGDRNLAQPIVNTMVNKAINEGIQSAFSAAPTAAADTAATTAATTAADTATTTAATEALASTAASEAASTGLGAVTGLGASAASTGLTSGVSSLIGSGASTALAGSLSGTAAGMGGGAAAGATTGSVAGPVGAAVGAIVGTILPELFAADGGYARGLKRRDMRRGGDVDGPGGPTDDAIPARLSDGEYVLNAEAVKLLGVDTLSRLNQIGLDMRGRKAYANKTRRSGGKRKGG